MLLGEQLALRVTSNIPGCLVLGLMENRQQRSRRTAVSQPGDVALESMLREHLVAGRIAIDSYRQIIACLGARDTTTRRLIEQILANEEAHAADLAGFMQGVSSGARAARS